MKYLVDTDVLSQRRTADPHPGVRAWTEEVEDTALFVSALTLGEIRSGVESIRPRDAAQAQRLDAWLGQLKRAYHGRVIPVNCEVTDQWGRLDLPESLTQVDGLVAATALVHDLVLVTGKSAAFAGTDVQVLNPFDAP